MKLTNQMRDAFVRYVMADVPNVDYSEEVRKLVVDSYVAASPKLVQEMWASNELRSYVNTATVSAFGGNSITVPTNTGRYQGIQLILPANVQKKYDAMKVKYETQNKTRDGLRSTLKGAAYACTTTNALVTALPEFEKYIPKDEPAAIRSLPVLTNVVADFKKAGWSPKKVVAAA